MVFWSWTFKRARRRSGMEAILLKGFREFETLVDFVLYQFSEYVLLLFVMPMDEPFLNNGGYIQYIVP
jgi:hypothetical protein